MDSAFRRNDDNEYVVLTLVHSLSLSYVGILTVITAFEFTPLSPEEIQVANRIGEGRVTA